MHRFVAVFSIFHFLGVQYHTILPNTCFDAFINEWIEKWNDCFKLLPILVPTNFDKFRENRNTANLEWNQNKAGMELGFNNNRKAPPISIEKGVVHYVMAKIWI